MKYRIVNYWGRYISEFKFLWFWVPYSRRETFKTPDEAEDHVRSSELRRRGTGRVIREFVV